MYEYEIKPSLLKKLKKIKNKDIKSYSNILNKINEIISSLDIDHYKNLKKPLQDFKRVHVNSHFILTFSFHKEKHLIEFVDYRHHDDAYL
jgi:mRNA-degrading endonuclease RelE of RelBE toxin-antitoxin system